MMAERSVLVRGGGVVGLCCAVVLAESGMNVTLQDTGGRIGSGASWMAGGMLAPWCEAETTPFALDEVGSVSLDWWKRHFADTIFNGTLVLAPARDSRELDRFGRRTSHHRPLDERQIAEIEPDLDGRFSRGLFFPGEAHLDPRDALHALERSARRLGVVMLLAEPDLPATGYDHIVDARGMGGAERLSDLRGVRGEMMLVRCPEVRLSRAIRLLHPRHPIYVVPRANNVFMIGATMIETDDAANMRLRSAMDLMGAAYGLHPAFADAELVEVAVGTRPSYPDNVPRVKESDGIISVNGMYRHGYLMAPVLAGRVRDLIVGDVPPKATD